MQAEMFIEENKERQLRGRNRRRLKSILNWEEVRQEQSVMVVVVVVVGKIASFDCIALHSKYFV